jgi:RimJ/RimL family protein N-acetyltransferase
VDVPVEYARGEKIVLRPLEAADAPLLVRWMNDPDVTQYLARVLPMSMHEEEDWIRARATGTTWSS